MEYIYCKWSTYIFNGVHILLMEYIYY